MLSLALAALIAGQVDVSVVHGLGPEADAARAVLCPKKPCLDATIPHAYFFSGGMLGQDFGAFAAPPPAWWPKKLATTWTEGLAHCQALAGPPPWKDTVAAAYACAQRLSSYLWTKWLTEQKARRVVVVTLSKAGKVLTVATESYDFPASQAFVQHEELKEATVARVKQLTTDARDARGTPTPIELITELAPKSGGPSPLGEATVKTPVAKAKKCDAAPAILRVTGGAPSLNESVSARWAASEIGKGPPLDCKLSESSHEESLMGSPMVIVNLALACGATRVSVEVGVMPQVNALDLGSAKLVTGLAARLCP